MTIDRKIWSGLFSYWPAFPCPNCGENSFMLDNDESFQDKETKESKSRHYYDETDICDFEGKFLGFMQCHDCKEIGVVCGNKYYEPKMVYGDEDAYMKPTPSYQPIFFTPSPPVFSIPFQCPGSVRKQLVRAFALLWNDHEACANRLRVALEAMVDNLHAAKREEDSVVVPAVPNNSSLDAKIKAFKDNEPELCKQLLALKFLGNFGSHNERKGFLREDIIGAFEHFEYALNLAYIGHEARLEKRAQKIIVAKGPTKR